MSILRILEYLLYLVLLIILIKCTDSASLEKKVKVVDNVSTTLERTLTEERDYMRHSLKECNQSFSWMCLKIEFLKLLERLGERDEIHLLKGLSLVRDHAAKELRNSEILADVARNYPSDPHVKLNGYLLSKVHDYLRTHYLRLKFLDAQTIVEARSVVETERKGSEGGGMGGGGKKGNNYEALIAVALMMKGTLMAMGMGAIALVAGKALMTALMALTLAAAIGLRGLARPATYEVLTKPMYTHMHSMTYDDAGQHHMGGGGGAGGTSGYGSYSRSMNIKSPHTLIFAEKL